MLKKHFGVQGSGKVPGELVGVVVRLPQCGEIVTCSSSSERFIKLFRRALVLTRGTAHLECGIELTS